MKDPRSDCSEGETEEEEEEEVEVEAGKGWGDVEVDVTGLEDMGRENPTRLLCSRLPASSLRPETELEFPVPVAVALALAGPIGVVLRVTLAALLDTLVLVFVFVLGAVRLDGMLLLDGEGTQSLPSAYVRVIIILTISTHAVLTCILTLSKCHCTDETA